MNDESASKLTTELMNVDLRLTDVVRELKNLAAAIVSVSRAMKDEQSAARAEPPRPPDP